MNGVDASFSGCALVISMGLRRRSYARRLEQRHRLTDPSDAAFALGIIPSMSTRQIVRVLSWVVAVAYVIAAVCGVVTYGTVDDSPFSAPLWVDKLGSIGQIVGTAALAILLALFVRYAWSYLDRREAERSADPGDR
jgi:hypothetical protein